MDEGEKRYALDKNFSYNSAMTLTLDLETWLKVTVYPLPKGTMWVKYGPCNLCQGERNLGQTDNYKARAERGPNNGACESVLKVHVFIGK